MQVVIFRIMVCSVLLATFSGAACAQNVPDEDAVSEQCSNEGSQADMHDCLVRKAAQSTAELGKAEKALRQALAKWDEDPPYVSEATAKLDAATKEFERYRKAQCDFSASLAGGGAGNSRDNARLACVVELNLRRVVQLKSVTSRLPSK
jgi:uncharacterized protein YecT (DUF1311 family)